MIDISQWRASIGLWYYQICDNVIDKSLPALCRKVTRAKKQSSNEKHSQTNMNGTAVEQISSNEIPQYRANRRNRYSNPVLVVSNGQTPVVSINGQTPTDGQKPLSNSQTPVTSTDGQTPVVYSDNMKPVVLSSKPGQKPVASSNNQEPVALSYCPNVRCGVGQTPVDGIHQTSINGQKPVALSNSSTASTTMRYADWCGRVQTISLAVFLFLLLILSGDIELNPGPKTGK